MNNAELYSAFNQHQRVDAYAIVKEFKHILKEYMIPESQILDIGSGDGFVTTEIIKNCISNNRAQIIGGDISKNMVDFARKKYNAVTGVDFIEMDASKSVDSRWVDSFDMIVSFYCFQLIPDQSMVFNNIHKMLKKKGGSLIIYPLRHPVFNIYEILMENPSWSDMMKDVRDKYIPYLRKFDYSEDECRKVLESAKLNIKHLEIKSRTFSFDGLDNFKQFFKSVNPYIGEISPEKAEDYLSNAMEAALALPTVQVARDESGEIVTINLEYELLVIYSIK